MRSPLSIKLEIEQDADPWGCHRFDAWVLRTSAHSLGLWASGYPWFCQTDAGAVFRIEVIIIARCCSCSWKYPDHNSHLANEGLHLRSGCRSVVDDFCNRASRVGGARTRYRHCPSWSFFGVSGIPALYDFSIFQHVDGNEDCFVVHSRWARVFVWLFIPLRTPTCRRKTRMTGVKHMLPAFAVPSATSRS